MRFHLHEPWPDFMTFYGTIVSGAGWIVPKKYVEKVGDDGFKRAPVGLGPYKFVSHTPGVELVMEANEGYWRKMPSVKRLVFKSVPESTTRLAMLKRGEVDVAYLLEVPQAQEVKRDPNLKLAFSGGIATWYLDFLDQWDPKSPWHDRRVRLAANYAIDRQALSDAETLGASKPAGNHVPRTFEFALPIEPYPYDPTKAKQLLAEAGYPNGFDAGELHQLPPYFSLGEAIVGYFQAVGIRTRMRPMERAAYFSLHHVEEGQGRVRLHELALRQRRLADVGGRSRATARTRTAATPTSTRSSSSRRSRRTRRSARRCCTRSSGSCTSACAYGPIFEYIWPSGVGPRVAEPALMMINPVSVVGAARGGSAQETVTSRQRGEVP